jgi:hypothetical protein
VRYSGALPTVPHTLEKGYKIENSKWYQYGKSDRKTTSGYRYVPGIMFMILELTRDG